MKVLFMLMLGCKPEGRLTEQHDTFFTIADHIINTEEDAKAFWPEADKIHIDAWRKIRYVEDYSIEIFPKDQQKTAQETDMKLFFINLGGYKKDEFDEFHYKVLAVGKNIGEAIAV